MIKILRAIYFMSVHFSLNIIKSTNELVRQTEHSNNAKLQNPCLAFGIGSKQYY
jgi:hypothetical protein